MAGTSSSVASCVARCTTDAVKMAAATLFSLAMTPLRSAFARIAHKCFLSRSERFRGSEHFADMAVDLDLGPEAADHAFLVDQHGGALDSHVFAAVHALLDPDAVFLADLAALIGGEDERQRIFLLELVVRPHRVPGNAYDRRGDLGEVGHRVAKAAGFLSAAGGVVLGIEIHHDLLAALRLEGDAAVAIGRQREIRRLVADRKVHLCFSESGLVGGNLVCACAAGSSMMVR